MTVALLGRPTTAVGFELLVVEPLPSTPDSPLPQAYTRPLESNSECVRAPVASVTSLSGICSGRSCQQPRQAEITVGVEAPSPHVAAASRSRAHRRTASGSPGRRS